MVKNAVKHHYCTLAKGKINKDDGVIYGVSLIEMGVAKGHNLIIDQTTLQQVTNKSRVYQNGLKVKLNHGSGVDAICGRIDNIRVEGEKVVGDFHLLKNHPSFGFILEMAEFQPDTFGLSVAFQGTPEAVPTGLAARVDEIFSCDLVCEPAATEALFEAKCGEKEGRVGEDEEYMGKRVDKKFSVMGTNLTESKGAERTETPEKEVKPGEESLMGRMSSLESRLKSFEEALLSWNKKDEEDEEDTEMSDSGDGVELAEPRPGNLVTKAVGAYVKHEAGKGKKLIKKIRDKFEDGSDTDINELVRQEVVKQFSALGVSTPPAPSVAEQKKEDKKPSFFEIVDSKVKEGMTRGKAVEFVVANNPEAHMSYLENLGIYRK